MKGRVNNLVNQRFGMLTVLSRDANYGFNTRWLCKCDCGNEKVIFALALKSKSSPTKSCGCQSIATAKKLNTTHGMTGTPEWRAWCSMHARCSNPNLASFKDYGGRGISVCDKWKSFECFFSDMKAKPSKDYQLDRIDNNGNYEPSNCRWATRKQNMQNRRVTKRYNGLTLRQISNLTGINYNTLKTRSRRNMPLTERK